MFTFPFTVEEEEKQKKCYSAILLGVIHKFIITEGGFAGNMTGGKLLGGHDDDDDYCYDEDDNYDDEDDNYNDEDDNYNDVDDDDDDDDYYYDEDDNYDDGGGDDDDDDDKCLGNSERRSLSHFPFRAEKRVAFQCLVSGYHQK